MIMNLVILLKSHFKIRSELDSEKQGQCDNCITMYIMNVKSLQTLNILTNLR